MIKVEVYGPQECRKCLWTITTMRNRGGFAAEKITLQGEPGKWDLGHFDPRVKELIENANSAPVVVVWEDDKIVMNWTDFRPDRIEDCKAYIDSRSSALAAA